VFEGGGYGVGVTVVDLEPVPWPQLPPPPGVEVHPARLGEMMPVAARTQAEQAAELARVDRVEAQVAAYKVELVAGMARASAAADDRRSRDPDERLPEVAEFFPDELAQILNCSRAAATTLAELSLTLVERLPSTWAALADQRIDWPRARVIARELGWPARECDPAVVAEVEAAVLPEAMELPVTRLQALVRRELTARDAAAADRRRREAEKTAYVTVHPLGDGLAELRATMPQPLAAAIRDTVDTYARLAKAAGETAPIGALRAGVLADLVLRPWDTGRLPVTAHLTVLAPLPALVPAEPGPLDAFRRPAAVAAPVGEVNGQPVTAAHLRELLAQLDALCPGGLQAPAGGTLDLALVDPDSGDLRAVVTRSELGRLARRGCSAHPTTAESGTGDCRCPVLDRPEAVDRYRPTPAQYRYVRTRDRTCRHPGCTVRAGWADLDHAVPHAEGGPTDCANLCCLCRRHHRLKTHARGWSFILERDGTLTVTTPTGITRTTRPPGLDLLAPATGRQPSDRSPTPGDDPPPF
jgi:hypothetical protein